MPPVMPEMLSLYFHSEFVPTKAATFYCKCNRLFSVKENTHPILLSLSFSPFPFLSSFLFQSEPELKLVGLVLDRLLSAIGTPSRGYRRRTPALADQYNGREREQDRGREA